MQTNQAHNLVIVGTMAIDAVETPFGKKESVFGGSASYAAYAASFFHPASIVSVVGEDFPEDFKNILRARSINLDHVDVRPGKTFRWRGRYGYDLHAAETIETQVNVLAELHPRWNRKESPGYLFLANVDPVVQLELLRQIERPRAKFVAADTMNFWIDGSRNKLDELMAKIDMLVVNDGEARLLAGETSLIKAARKIQESGPPIVVVKKGEHGVLLFYEQETFMLPAYPLEDVFDPTGAGDTFGGSLVGYLASKDQVDFHTLRRAVAYGTVVASFTVEKFGLERLQALRMSDIEERLDAFRRMCAFS